MTAPHSEKNETAPFDSFDQRGATSEGTRTIRRIRRRASERVPEHKRFSARPSTLFARYIVFAFVITPGGEKKSMIERSVSGSHKTPSSATFVRAEIYYLKKNK